MTDTQSPKKSSFWLWLLLLPVLALLMWQFVPQAPKPKTPKTDTPKIYAPVVYDIDNWSPTTKTKNLDNADLLQRLGGSATVEDGLDFVGAKAVMYRYTALTEPVLMAIDSDELLEMRWYHAIKDDNDDDKSKSISHAQKVYSLLGAVYGDDAKALLGAILTHKKPPNLAGVVVASCRDYECQVVLNKAKVGINSTTKKATKG